MSPVFGRDYAAAYDALYQDKDYEAECRQLQRLMERYAPLPVASVLDLGCGSGSHALPFARAGLAVTGVDRSGAMLAHARAKAGAGSVEFVEADVRICDLGRTFDAAVMLFAVLGYQVENADVLAAMATARRHLEPGGLFVFDCWYGPAVLAQRPTDRVKTAGSITRYAVSALDVRRHTCVVDFRVENDSRVCEEIHTLRYFFPRELELYLELAGFSLLRLGCFPDFEREPGETDWNAMGVARAL